MTKSYIDFKLIALLCGVVTFPLSMSYAAPPSQVSQNSLQVQQYISETHDPFYLTQTELSLSDISICNESDIYCKESSYQPVQFQKAKFTCVGGGDDGGWDAAIPKNVLNTSQCWQNLEICFDSNYESCITYTHGDANIPDAHVAFKSISPSSISIDPNNFSLCGDDDSSQHKEYCTWNYDAATSKTKPPAHGAGPGAGGIGQTVIAPIHATKAQSNALSKRIKGKSPFAADMLRLTGETGDDMFRLPNDDNVILEFLDIPATETYGLMHLKTDAAMPYDMMVPAGPLDPVSNKNTAQDYKNFIDLAKSGKVPNVSAYNACFPAEASIKCNTSAMVIQGECGTNNGETLSHMNFKLSGNEACAVGSAKLVSSNSNSIQWICRGYNKDNSATAINVDVNCSATLTNP